MTATTDKQLSSQTAGSSQDIVVGVDGSEESFAALHWAITEAHKNHQQVNAVYGWTPSWDLGGSEPESDAAWQEAYQHMREEIHDWLETHGDDFPEDTAALHLTSVRSSGTAALLEIGKNASQIVIGRRSINRIARWILGSTSASLAQEAQVPVTIVRLNDATLHGSHTADDTQDEHSMQGIDAENILLQHHSLPLIVGIDGSQGSQHALNYALTIAERDNIPLHVMFCWQMKDLSKFMTDVVAVPSIEIAEKTAQSLVEHMINQCPKHNVEIIPHVFHIPATKGLLNVSRYARRIIVGSRGLSGFDAHFIGSISREIVDFAQCTVTVVH